MRRFLIVIVLALGTTFAANAQLENNPLTPRKPKIARITFEETVMNYGKIPDKESVTREFAFTNTGDAPLVILRTEVSCSCLETEYPKDPVPSGGSGVIKVTYVAKKGVRQFQVMTDVITNTPEKRHTLFSEGEVVKKKKKIRTSPGIL